MTNTPAVSMTVGTRHELVLKGEIAQPMDREEPVQYRAAFAARMLPGLRDYLCREEPWDLWLGADGEFPRDGTICEITALRFGWTAWDGRPMLEIVADVVNERDPGSAEANVRQPLCYLASDEVGDLVAGLTSPVTPQT